jgi:hypothetical protein
MNLYVLYFSEMENSYTFIEKKSAGSQKLPEDALLIWEVNAISWEAANQLKHDFLGWEPYKPMPE